MGEALYIWKSPMYEHHICWPYRTCCFLTTIIIISFYCFYCFVFVFFFKFCDQVMGEDAIIVPNIKTTLVVYQRKFTLYLHQRWVSDIIGSIKITRTMEIITIFKRNKRKYFALHRCVLCSSSVLRYNIICIQYM